MVLLTTSPLLVLLGNVRALVCKPSKERPENGRLHAHKAFPLVRPSLQQTMGVMADFTKNARIVYERHYNHIRSVIPAQRLLVYDIMNTLFLGVSSSRFRHVERQRLCDAEKWFDAALVMTSVAIPKKLRF